MNNSLLTIIIPTYNRVSFLGPLLDQIESETFAFRDNIAVLVLDNHSSDDTPQLVEPYIIRNTNWRYVRHPRNIGPDLNFLSGIDGSSSSHFWIISDDDMPRSGVLPEVLRIIRHVQPTLLYLPSEWMPTVRADALPAVAALSPLKYSPVEFSAKINVWTTFISSWVVSKRALFDAGITTEVISSYQGTLFIQLAWIVPLISEHSLLLAVETPCVFATSGNSGGYQPLTLFCVNYPSVVRRASRSRSVSRALIDHFIRQDLPRRISIIRDYNNRSRFLSERFVFARAMISIGNFASFWTHALPAFFPVLRVFRLRFSRLLRQA